MREERREARRREENTRGAGVFLMLSPSIFAVAVKGGDSLHAHCHLVILLGYHDPLCLIFGSITDRS